MSNNCFHYRHFLTVWAIKELASQSASWPTQREKIYTQLIFGKSVETMKTITATTLPSVNNFRVLSCHQTVGMLVQKWPQKKKKDNELLTETFTLARNRENRSRNRVSKNNQRNGKLHISACKCTHTHTLFGNDNNPHFLQPFSPTTPMAHFCFWLFIYFFLPPPYSHFSFVRQTAKNNRKLLNLIFILDVFQFHQLEHTHTTLSNTTHTLCDVVWVQSNFAFAKLLSLRIRNIC